MIMARNDVYPLRSSDNGDARTDPADRRQHPRISKPPLHVSGVRADVVDVSQGGVGLRLEGTDLKPGDICELIVTDAITHQAKTLEAEVVWVAGKKAGLRWKDPYSPQITWLRSRFDLWDRDRKLHRALR
jgi:hypothetical protein